MATSGELCPHISKLPTGSSHPDPIGDFVRLNPVILDLNISYREAEIILGIGLPALRFSRKSLHYTKHSV